MFGCSSSNKGVESATTIKEAVTTSTQKPSKTIEAATDDVIRTLGQLLEPDLNNWNCEGPNPLAEAKERFETLDNNCVWSEVPGVVKVHFKCFFGTAMNPDKKIECRTLLNQMSEKLSIFSLAESATMPNLTPLEGLQTGSNGVSTWRSAPGLGLVIVIDVAKQVEVVSG